MSRKTPLYRLASPSIRERHIEARYNDHLAQSMATRAAHLTALLTQVVLSLSPDDHTVNIPADELRPASVDDILEVAQHSGALVLHVRRVNERTTTTGE